MKIKQVLQQWSEAELMSLYSHPKLPKRELKLITNELLKRLTP